MDILHEIERSGLLARRSKLLVGISGGVDSVVLLHALCRGGYRCVAAHCNFHLRGAAADGDARFVEEYAASLGCGFVRADFDTEEYASARSLSTEMAARELRYRWFEERRAAMRCDAIAVAHNANDSVETFFLNAVRGTGVRGMAGMAARNGYVVRPLLSVTREEIEKYARDNALAWRCDATNDETVYRRNKIRHQIIPVLQDINPSFIHTMLANMEHWRDAGDVFRAHAESARKRCCRQTGDVMSINISSLSREAGYRSLFFEWLYGYGFSPDVISAALEAMDGIPGKRFESGSHVLLKDRGEMLLMPKRVYDAEESRMVVIEEGDTSVDTPLSMSFRLFDRGADYEVPRSAYIVAFDADRVNYPLTLRRPETGERFVPFGMRGSKKLSDFFVDRKLSMFDKERAMVLVSAGGEVMWVVGMRTDNRFAVTDKTRRILQVELHIKE